MSPMLSTIGRIATEFAAVRTRYQAARLRYETERALNALPPEVQKDPKSDTMYVPPCMAWVTGPAPHEDRARIGLPRPNAAGLGTGVHSRSAMQWSHDVYDKVAWQVEFSITHY